MEFVRWRVLRGEARYGITGCVWELNADWIAGLDAPPTADNWKLWGRRLPAALDAYFAQSP